MSINAFFSVVNDVHAEDVQHHSLTEGLTLSLSDLWCHDFTAQVKRFWFGDSVCKILTCVFFLLGFCLRIFPPQFSLHVQSLGFLCLHTSQQSYSEGMGRNKFMVIQLTVSKSLNMYNHHISVFKITNI